ncbi:MAG: phage major capsid protein [Rhodococcus sp.]|nr:phage major capsid protein [Rhodococcus sp. (in: high G+C Gram-positive bacteria)]MBJ7325363.1 phage major capsid protein [Rhodococcus sp. (in: high G+C Gram-positive bacteria)]
MKTLEEIRHRITNAKAEARSLVDAADQTRGLEGDSLDRFDALTAELTELRTEEAKIVARQAELASLVGQGAVEHSHATTESRTVVAPNPLKGVSYLKRDQSIEDWNHDNGVTQKRDSSLSFDRYVRGMVTGEWNGASEERALATTTAGGILIPAPIAEKVIQLSRNKSRVIEAGALTVPMTSSTLKLPRLTGDVGPSWRAEGAAVANNDLTFDTVTLTAKSLSRMILVSREALQDSNYVGDVIAEAFAASFASELDRAALYGSGTGAEPLGVKNTSGILTTAHGANGGALTYDFLLDAAGKVSAENYTPNAHILAPRGATALSKAKDTAGNYLVAPNVLPILTSGTVPVNGTTGTSTDTSDVFTAEWGYVAIGIRETFTLQVADQLKADYGQIAFIAHMRADVCVLQPKAVHVDTGVR